MKTLATAILLLFATSLFGAAFASGCMAMPPASMADHAQEQALSCCDVKAACMGGSCIATKHDAGCTSDHGLVGQKSQSAPDLVKAPELSVVPALFLATIARDAVARSPYYLRDSVHITGYADVYARTGRLLI